MKPYQHLRDKCTNEEVLIVLRELKKLLRHFQVLLSVVPLTSVPGCGYLSAPTTVTKPGAPTDPFSKTLVKEHHLQGHPCIGPAEAPGTSCSISGQFPRVPLLSSMVWNPEVPFAMAMLTSRPMSGPCRTAVQPLRTDVDFLESET